MKTLQSNFITSEQSKRLLELGLPADSADCYISNEKIFVLHNCTFQENFNNDLDIARSHLIDMPHYIPCWSVGRLIELYMKARGLDFMYFRIMSDADMIDSIIRMFVENQNEIDFSKLEE